jgi:glycosyltransferase involved in cell wall biosynthesis
MRVLFPYPREFGFFPDIYEYVTLLREFGIDAFYVGKMDAMQKEIPSYAFHTSERDMNNQDFVRFASEIVDKIDPDLVHVFHFRSSGLLPFRNRHHPHTKWLMDVRTVHVLNRNHSIDPFFPLKDRITWLETQAYDRILALTPEIKKRMWPSLKPVQIVPLGASWERFNPPNQDVLRRITRARLGISDDAPVILYAGSLSPTRKLCRVIDAFARVLTQHPETRLVVVGGEVGKAPDEDAFIRVLKHQAGELGINKNVLFVGRRPYPDMSPFYTMADIGISYMPLGTPHQYQPPTKVIEYMMAGVLVVSNQTPAIRALIADEINGLLCGDEVEQLADGLSKALTLLFPQNRQHLQEIKAAARNSMRNRDWRIIVRDHLIPLYNCLCDPTKRA